MKKIRYLLFILLVSTLIVSQIKVKAFPYEESSYTDSETGISYDVRTYSDTYTTFDTAFYDAGANVYSAYFRFINTDEVTSELASFGFSTYYFICSLHLVDDENNDIILETYTPEYSYYSEAQMTESDVKEEILEDVRLAFDNYYFLHNEVLNEEKQYNLYFEIKELENQYTHDELYSRRILKFIVSPFYIYVEHEDYTLSPTIIEDDDSIVLNYNVPQNIAKINSEILPPNGAAATLNVSDMNYFKDAFESLEGIDLNNTTFSLYKEFGGASFLDKSIHGISDYSKLYNLIGNKQLTTFDSFNNPISVKASLKCELAFDSKSPYAEKYVVANFYFDEVNILPKDEKDYLEIKAEIDMECFDPATGPTYYTFVDITLNSVIFKNHDPEFNSEFTMENLYTIKLIQNDDFIYGRIPLTMDKEHLLDGYHPYTTQIELETSPNETLKLQAVFEYLSGGKIYTYTSNVIEITPADVNFIIDDVKDVNQIDINEEYEISFEFTTPHEHIYNFNVEADHDYFNIEGIPEVFDSIDEIKGTIQGVSLGDGILFVSCCYDLDDYITVFIFGAKTLEIVDPNHPTYTLNPTIIEDDYNIEYQYDVPKEAMSLNSEVLPPDGAEVNLYLYDIYYLKQVFSSFEGLDLSKVNFTIYKEFSGTPLVDDTFKDIKNYTALYNKLKNHKLGTFEHIKEEINVNVYLECVLSFDPSSPYAEKYVVVNFYFNDVTIKPIVDGDFINITADIVYENFDPTTDPSYSCFLTINLDTIVFKNHEASFNDKYTLDNLYSIKIIQNDNFVYGNIPLTKNPEMIFGGFYQYYTNIEMDTMPTESLTIQAIFEYLSDGTIYTYKSNIVELKPLNLNVLIDGLSSTKELEEGEEYELSFALPTTYKYINYFHIEADADVLTVNPIPLNISSINDAKTTIKPINVADCLMHFSTTYLVDDYTTINLMVSKSYKIVNTEPVKINYDTDIMIYGDANQDKINEVLNNVATLVNYSSVDNLLNITLNDYNSLILGGPKVLFYCYIDPKFDDGNLEYSWKLASDNGTISIITLNNAIIVEGLKEGKQKIILDVTGYSIGSVHKEFGINVVDLENSNISITYPTGFHKSGNDIKFDLQINDAYKFLNLDITFSVRNNDGDYSNITVDKTSITINNPPENDYIVTATIDSNASFESFKIESEVIEVRKVDVDKLIQSLLPLIAILMVALVVAAIVLKKNTDKTHSLDKILDKAVGAANEALPQASDYSKKLIKTHVYLRRALSKEEDLSIENSGQYDNLIGLTKKALKTLEGIIRTNKKFDVEQKEAALNTFKEQLYKLLKLSVDLETARKKLNEERNKAGRTAIVDVKKEKPNKK